MNKDIKSLSTGTASFELLRQMDLIYVDKTDMAAEIAAAGRTCLLTRPRRFGKTLLGTTFASLFSKGLECFHGLKIEKLWHEKKTYKVIRLDLSFASYVLTAEGFRERFEGGVLDRFIGAGIPLKTTESNTLKSRLCKTLAEFEDSSIVLIIDEYDNPMNATLSDTELHESVCQYMTEFYAILSDPDIKRKFRFIFLTGITRNRHTGISSGFSDLRDLTLDPKYGTLLGYTEEEIERYFADYLALAEKKLSLSHAELMHRLVESYGGFCFDDGARSRVCAPWSVQCFFDAIKETEFSCGADAAFSNYWYATGGTPQMLTDLLRELPLEDLLKGGCIEVDRRTYADQAEVGATSAETVLLQAGYLTIRKETEDKFILSLTNREVVDSLSELAVGVSV